MNAVIFVRVSKKDQDYNRQIADLEILAKSKGYKVVEVITEKISGAKKTNDRPSLKRLMQLATSSTFNTLFITEVTRLGRNTREVINVVEDLHEAGINIFISNYNLETIVNGKRNPIAQFMVTLLIEFARVERENLIERTKSGLEHAKRMGKSLGRPTGSVKDSDSILEEYSGIVKSLKKGLSVREAAKVNDVSNNTVMKVKKAM